MVARGGCILWCCNLIALAVRHSTGLRLSNLLKESSSVKTFSSNASGFNVEPFLSLLNIWSGEVTAKFNQAACPAPYDDATGCKAYQNATGKSSLLWHSYVVQSTQEKCCTPCKFPPPCSQYDSVLSSERAQPYQFRAGHAMTAARKVLGKDTDPFPCCKGSMDEKRSRFEVAMAAVIDRVVKLVKEKPDETMVTWTYVYKGMIRNYAAQSAGHLILDAGNSTLESIAQLMSPKKSGKAARKQSARPLESIAESMKIDYEKLTADAKAMATKEVMNETEIKELRLKKAKVAFAALNLLVTSIHVLGWNMGLWQTLIDNMLNKGPDGGCSMTLAEIIMPGESGSWASLASKDAAGCAFGLSVMLTVGVAQRTASLSSFTSFPVAGKVAAVGRGLKRMLFAEKANLYIYNDEPLLQTLLKPTSGGVKLPIREKRREGDFNKDYIYTLEAVNGTRVESNMHFSFVPSVDEERAYLQCTYAPETAVQKAIGEAYQAAVDSYPDENKHMIRFKPQRKIQGTDGLFEGLGRIAEFEAVKMGYDVGAIFFMWYVGYWQFYLLDATWRSGISAWKLLRAEVENGEDTMTKGPQDIAAALKGEAVLAVIAAAEAKKQNKSSGILSFISNLLPRSPTCAEEMAPRYVRAFAGLSRANPEDFVAEACGLMESRTPLNYVEISDTLGLLEAFFGISRSHLEKALAKAKKADRGCDAGAEDLLGKLQACGLLEWQCLTFDGECCDDRFWIGACLDIYDDPHRNLGQALQQIEVFQTEFCSVAR